MHRATVGLLAILFLTSVVPVGAHPALDGVGPHAHALVDVKPGIVVEPAPVPRQIYTANEIQFRCPEGPMGLPFAPNADALDRTVYGCPIRVYDTTNPFGNPKIALLDDDPREVAFCALHGSPTGPEEGAHGYSRRGQTHTVFTSYDQGLSWEDQPIGGGAIPNGGQGETADCVMDSTGMLYIGYTWAHPVGTGDNKTYGTTIALYKAGSTRDRGSVMNAYSDPFIIESQSTAHPIEEIHVVRAGRVFIPDNMTAFAENEETGYEEYEENGTAGNDTEYGDEAIPGNWTKERIVAVFHEGAAVPRLDGSMNYNRGRIVAYQTDTSAKNHWTPINETDEIGPCMDASNPVVVGHTIYVACTVGAGYDHRGRAKVGQVDIWAIDPETLETRHVDYTGVMGLNPRLAAAPDGYMVLTTHRLVADEYTGGATIEANAAFGWHGRQWSAVRLDFGAALRQVAGNDPIVDADITALSISEDDHGAILIYKEFYPPSSEQDVQRAVDSGVRLVDYKKIVMTFNVCDGPLAAAEMITGTGVDAYQSDAYAMNPEIYNDHSDGLYYHRDPGGEELWTFAVNDYGAMQYGSVIASSSVGSGDFCIVPPYIPPAPVPALPQALTSASGASTGIMAAIGIGAVSMSALMIAARRRAADPLAAEDN